MTEQQLKKYPGIMKRIAYFEKKIEEATGMDLGTVAGKVKGSSSNFPYTERRFSVHMDDPAQLEKLEKKIHKWKKKIDELRIEAEEIEDFIEEIEDDTLREMFELHFLKDMKQQAVAEMLGIDQSRVSRRIREYLKAHK